MKTLELNQMQHLQGGEIDCSQSAQMSRVAGAAIGGALFFGWGAVLTTFGMVLYNGFSCEDAGAEASQW